MLLGLLNTIACSSPEPEKNFENKPIERIEAKKKELREVVKASKEGWKLIYFPNSEELGGFTHFFKFTTDDMVEMASDFDKDNNTKTSDYDIVLGSTISLVFTTKNRIHLLSDSGNSATSRQGGGYSGDFQFLYYGHKKDTIIFATNRTLQELLFVKATAQQWKDLPKHLEMESLLKTGSIEFIKGKNKEEFSFQYVPKTRLMTIRNKSKSHRLGIALTPNGLIINPQSNKLITDEPFGEFIYDKDNKTFSATAKNGISCVIRPR